MKIIGITGGVGSGKSLLLDHISKNYNAYIILSDNLANFLCEPGQACYEPVKALIGEECIKEDGFIDRKKMASKIFVEPSLLEEINGVIHPAVNRYILEKIGEKKKEGKTDFFFIEAALLIECGYKNIVDELWYVYTDEKVRRERLKESRNYSDEKIDSIIKNQLSEKEYRDNADFIIDNSGEPEAAYKVIDERMRG